MARSYNQVTLMGNLTRDPEIRQTTNGKKVCAFSLALNRSYKDVNDKWVDATDYVDIVSWGPLAERAAQYLKKGKQTLLTGRLQSTSWEKDGQKRTKLEVVANEIIFLGSGDSQEIKQQPAVQQKDTVNNSFDEKDPINLDDIPF